MGLWESVLAIVALHLLWRIACALETVAWSLGKVVRDE